MGPTAITGMTITTDLQVGQPTDAALPAASPLHLILLASPAFPVGGFSFSEGLEADILRWQLALKNVANDINIEVLSGWICDQLQLTLARGDLAVIAHAVPAWRGGHVNRITDLSDWLLQTRETSELRAQTEQMGRSLCNWLVNLEDIDAAKLNHCTELPPTYPIAYAPAAVQTEAGIRDCLLAYAFGWAKNMVQAANFPETERQAFSPMLKILSSQHETQYSRLFRS